jgi:hypothetical protein
MLAYQLGYLVTQKLKSYSGDWGTLGHWRASTCLYGQRLIEATATFLDYPTRI